MKVYIVKESNCKNMIIDNQKYILPLAEWEGESNLEDFKYVYWTCL